MARRTAVKYLADYLERHPRAFMLINAETVWWSQSERLLPGRSADNSFRVVMATGQERKHNRESRFMSHVFRAIVGGLDTAQCIERAWGATTGPACCIIVEPPYDPSTYLLSDRALTVGEGEHDVWPYTKHITVGAFRNDLLFIWSSE